MLKKKIYIFLLIPFLCAIFLFVGCGANVVILTANWMGNNPEEAQLEKFYEKTTYSLTHKNGQNKDLQFQLTDGSFTQEIKGLTSKTTNIASSLIHNGLPIPTNGYSYSMRLTIQGKYILNGKETPIDDTIESIATIRTVQNQLIPIVSEQKVRSHTPIYDMQQKTFKIEAYDYTVVKHYNEDASRVKIRIVNKLNGQLSEKEYAKINKGNRAYDSTQLYFLARALPLSNNFNATFHAVNDNGIQAFSTTTSLAREKFTNLPSAAAEQELDVAKIAISVAGNTIAKGPIRQITLSNDDNPYKKKSYLLKIEENLPYSLGIFTLQLTTIQLTPTSSPTP